MQLLYASASPFARKVRIVAIETGIEGRIELVPTTTTAVETAPSLARVNPLGKIPALVREGGPTLYDSRVICRYLDAIAGGGLYPEARIWEVLTLEATADGMMDAAVLITYERRFRAEDKQHPGWLDGQRSRIVRTLDALSERWMSHLGGRMTIGHVGIGAALGYLDFRHPDLEWRAGRPALAEWYLRFSERESMARTIPEG